MKKIIIFASFYPKKEKSKEVKEIILAMISKSFFIIKSAYFLSFEDISAPVVGSSSIPNGVIFLGSGVKVDSGLSA